MKNGYLEVGDRYRNHPDTGDTHVYEVLAVGHGSMTVRSAKRPTQFTAHEGLETEADVAFDKPGRRVQVARRVLGVTLVTGEEDCDDS